jgi:hypothetical protein
MSLVLIMIIKRVTNSMNNSSTILVRLDVSNSYLTNNVWARSIGIIRIQLKNAVEIQMGPKFLKIGLIKKSFLVSKNPL